MVDTQSSLYDRLTGGNKTRYTEEFYDSLRKDIETLLNSECRFKAVPSQLQHLDGSLLEFGVPEFSHLQASDTQTAAEIAEAFRATLVAWEPRLTRISVVPTRDRRDSTTVLLRITASLAGQEDERLAFDTALQSVGQGIEVREPQ
ncbi:MAG: type VI secretion system baseplate subunit TssE [Pseudomonadota bacterium]